MIGADSSKRHIHRNVRYTSDEDPCAVKTELGWVLLGGKKSSLHVESSRFRTGVKTLDFETFWSTDSYGTVKKHDRILMTKEEKQTYEILQKKYIIEGSQYTFKK